MTLGEPDNCTCGRTVSGFSGCAVHGTKQDSSFIPPKDNNDDKPYPALSYLIPEGDYCYAHTGRIVINNRRIGSNGEREEVPYYFMPESKPCPFWKPLGGGDAYCAYLRETSSREECNNLMWDQVKSCGVRTKDYTLFELEEMRSGYNDPAWIKSNKREKILPHFMESLVTILLDSETNELTYDGITYTLSQHIYNSAS